MDTGLKTPAPAASPTILQILGFIDKWGKSIAFLFGGTYVFGYFITASRLAKYNIPNLKFFDTQYFAAGISLWFFSIVTVLVAILALKYPQKEKDALVASIQAIFFVMATLALVFNRQISSIGEYAVLLVSFIWGEAAVWLYLVKLQSRDKTPGVWKRRWENARASFSASWKKFIDGNVVGKIAMLLKGLEKLVFRFYMLVLGILIYVTPLILLITLPFALAQIYDEIPQAYGGGRPSQVQLYVDANKVPVDLLLPTVGEDVNGPVPTVPLLLIYQTADEIIVQELDAQADITWVLQRDAIYAFVSKR